MVRAGELIFVPIITQYRSHRYGSNIIEYISFHACFEQQCEPEALVGARLQRVSVTNFKALQQDFAFAEAHYNKTQGEQLQMLSIFYRLFANLLPRLCKNKAEHKPQIFRNPTSDQPASVPTWVKKAFV